MTADDLGVKLPDYNFTDDFNITGLNPEDTLKGSELTKINVSQTTEADIKRTFCKEVQRITAVTKIKLCYTNASSFYLILLCEQYLTFPFTAIK